MLTTRIIEAGAPRELMQESMQFLYVRGPGRVRVFNANDTGGVVMAAGQSLSLPDVVNNWAIEPVDVGVASVVVYSADTMISRPIPGEGSAVLVADAGTYDGVWPVSLQPGWRWLFHPELVTDLSVASYYTAGSALSFPQEIFPGARRIFGADLAPVPSWQRLTVNFMVRSVVDPTTRARLTVRGWPMADVGMAGSTVIHDEVDMDVDDLALVDVDVSLWAMVEVLLSHSVAPAVPDYGYSLLVKAHTR